MSSLKERNGRIGAFSPCGYSTFMTRQTDKKREKNIYVHSLYLRLALAWLNPSSNVNSLNFCPAYQVQLSVKTELTWIK